MWETAAPRAGVLREPGATARAESQRGVCRAGKGSAQLQAGLAGKGRVMVGRLSRRQLPGLDSGTASPVPWGCVCTCHPEFWSQSVHRAQRSRAQELWLAQTSLVQSLPLCTDLAAVASALLLCWLPPGMLSALINVTV